MSTCAVTAMLVLSQFEKLLEVAVVQKAVFITVILTAFAFSAVASNPPNRYLVDFEFNSSGYSHSARVLVNEGDIAAISFGENNQSESFYLEMSVVSMSESRVLVEFSDIARSSGERSNSARTIVELESEASVLLGEGGGDVVGLSFSVHQNPNLSSTNGNLSH